MNKSFGKMEIIGDLKTGIERLSHKDVADVVACDPFPEIRFAKHGVHECLDARHLISMDENGKELSLSYEIPGVLRFRWQLRQTNGLDGVIASGEVENIGNETIALEQAVLFRLTEPGGMLKIGQDLSDCSFFKNGWQSWSATESLRVTEKDFSPILPFLRVVEENPVNRASGVPGEFCSEAVTYIQNLKSGSGLLLGFVTGADLFSDIRLKIHQPGGRLKELEAACHFDGLELATGEKIQTEQLLVLIGEGRADLLSLWAQECGKRMKARVPDKLPVGWCSWYYYYTGVSSEAVLSNLDCISKLRESIDFQVFQIDDGYNTAVGDWLSINDKFPGGLAPMATAIAEKGFVPGIWTAPFIAGPGSKLLKEHPDWFIKTDKGKPVNAGFNPMWKGSYFALDPTHPEAENYIRNVFSSMKEMGFSFFKIDFIYAAALPGKRYRKNITRAQTLRYGLDMVREEIGEDAVLLGCGAPLLPCVGKVDVMRIGPDVAPMWNNKVMRRLLRDKNALSTLNALRNTTNRYFMHGNLWWNDPDCLMVRKDRTRLTVDEVKTLCSVIAASGGMVLVSDDLSKLPEDRVKLIQQVLQQTGEGFRPLDLMEKSYPELLAAPRPWGWLIAVVNYENKQVERVVGLDRFMTEKEISRIGQITDVWTGKVVRLREGMLPLSIPSHGTELLEIRMK